MWNRVSDDDAQVVLREFLEFPITSTDEVFAKFMTLPGAMMLGECSPERCVYVPGTRPDRIVLVAHADTVWDDKVGSQRCDERTIGEIQDVKFDGTKYYSGSRSLGIGADDRAGCAMLWLMRKSGHSLLITDGEEAGLLGSKSLLELHPEIVVEINQAQYMVQLDRRGALDYKVYNLPVPEEFHSFIIEKTGRTEPDKGSRTDIVVLCKTICGVNFSIGYYNEHSAGEHLVLSEWLQTFRMVAKLIAPTGQPRFLLMSQ